MKRLIAFVLLIFAGLPGAGQVLTDLGPGTDFAINFNPDEKSPLVWLSYNVCRIGFIMEHRKNYPMVGQGELSPRFGDELAGRVGALESYVVARETDQTPKDEYWEEVRKVDSAGFMREYVWFYLRRDDWPKKDAPKKLEKFDVWRSKNIPKHKPETYGTLEFKEKG